MKRPSTINPPSDRVLDSMAKSRMISRVHAYMSVTTEQDQDGRYKWTIRDNKSVNGLFRSITSTIVMVLERKRADYNHPVSILCFAATPRLTNLHLL